jgi:hypothetical protein
MNFSIAHQQSQWREELRAIFATFRAAKLSRESRDVAVAALEALLANVQSLPPAYMDTELELGQWPIRLPNTVSREIRTRNLFLAVLTNSAVDPHHVGIWI